MTSSHSVAFTSKFATALLAVFQITFVGMANGEAAGVEDKLQASKHCDEAMRLSKFGDDDRALMEIDEAIKLGAGPTAVQRKADILLELGKPQEALVEARKAVKLDPESAGAHCVLGISLDTLRLDSEALREFDIAIAKKPTDRGFRTWRSKLYERHHVFDKAIVDLTVVINSTEPRNRAALLERRGNCYSGLKDYTKAIADYSAALTSSYGRSALLRLRAAAYDKEGNHDAAKKDLQAAGTMDEVFEPPSTLGEIK